MAGHHTVLKDVIPLWRREGAVQRIPTTNGQVPVGCYIEHTTALCKVVGRAGRTILYRYTDLKNRRLRTRVWRMARPTVVVLHKKSYMVFG